MGYDLVAKEEERGAVSDYRVGTESMVILRSAMRAAGVPEALVYKKFVSNDNFFVTPLQARMVAQKLTTWLQGRNLMLDLSETNERASASTDGLLEVLTAVGDKKRAAELARLRGATSLPLRVDRDTRRDIRDFASFCAGSGGFYVS